MEIIMGVDVSSTELETNVMDSTSKSICNRFENSKSGCKKLIKYAAEHAVTSIVMEATGGYEQLLAKHAAKSGFAVKIVNPLQVRNFAKGIGKNAKTDKIDAYVIARFAHIVKLPETFSKKEEDVKLAQLVKRRNALKKIIEAEKNRKNLADDFIKKSMERVVKLLEKEVSMIENEMDKLVAESEILSQKCSVICGQKGIGKITALTLLALIPEIGSVNRKQIAALAGLAPIARDSGKMKGKRFISGGRFGPRKALYMPAWVAVQRDENFKNFYNSLISKGKKPKVAIVAVMRKLLVKVNWMISDFFEKSMQSQNT